MMMWDFCLDGFSGFSIHLEDKITENDASLGRDLKNKLLSATDQHFIQAFLSLIDLELIHFFLILPGKPHSPQDNKYYYIL